MASLHPQVQHRACDWEAKRVHGICHPKDAWLSSALGKGHIGGKEKIANHIYIHVHKHYFPGTNKVKAYCGSVCKGSAVLAVMFFQV